MKNTNNEDIQEYDYIPLVVKKAKRPHKKIKEESKKELPKKIKKPKDKLYIKLILKVGAVLITLVILVLLMTYIVKKISINDKSEIKQIVPPVIQEKIEVKDSLIGNWQTSLNGLFNFNDDSTFTWYDSIYEETNNYITGTYTYKQGLEALEEMGYTKEEYEVTFGSSYIVDKTLSLQMKPQKYYLGGQDKKDKLKDNDIWWFIIIVKNDNTAIAYNKTLDLRYNLTYYR